MVVIIIIRLCREVEVVTISAFKELVDGLGSQE